MMHLIFGGSDSGKSAYAERCVMESGSPVRYYVATMKAEGEEGRRRVQRHRRMREGKHFITVECGSRLEELRLPVSGEESALTHAGRRTDAAALLECMTNLTANEQFDVGGTDEAIVERIVGGVGRLCAQVQTLVVVTGDVSADGLLYDEPVMRYIRLLGMVNQRLAQMADEVTEVVYGIPVAVKRRQI
ncbi:MAG: bifunctional adenosylcobinamide kinase/adenosylcobinamide-phosphate guanylyltransferase [Clostridiales bacterium]|nr:bifunctional adenosylcobinamide kinase/adenosylcobinamide-phosphate guanylyltransferase [Clostridiales bacterium]